MLIFTVYVGFRETDKTKQLPFLCNDNTDYLATWNIVLYNTYTICDCMVNKQIKMLLKISNNNTYQKWRNDFFLNFGTREMDLQNIHMWNSQLYNFEISLLMLLKKFIKTFNFFKYFAIKCISWLWISIRF